MPLSPTKSNVYVLFQNKDIKGEGGLLTLKSVKRTDSGEYLCKGTDFDNFDKDLSAKLNLMVHCKWSTSTRQHNTRDQIKQARKCEEQFMSHLWGFILTVSHSPHD